MKITMTVTWHSAFRGWTTDTREFSSHAEALAWWEKHAIGYGRGVRMELNPPAPRKPAYSFVDGQWIEVA